MHNNDQDDSITEEWPAGEDVVVPKGRCMDEQSAKDRILRFNKLIEDYKFVSKIKKDVKVPSPALILGAAYKSEVARDSRGVDAPLQNLVPDTLMALRHLKNKQANGEHTNCNVPLKDYSYLGE